MNTSSRGLKISGILAGAALSLALTVAVSAPRQAQAAETNILADSNLTVGSSGDKVVVLQGLLSEMGYLDIPANVQHGYFGAMTRDAVGRYQGSQSVSPTAGYFGPATKIAMHQEFLSHGWLAMLGW